MDKQELLHKFYTEDHQFSIGVNELRALILETGLQETYKWNFPTYTLGNKNIVAICKFKAHFGVWFFNGVYLSDPNKVLENAQEGKTKAMRHWKFHSVEDIDFQTVTSYVLEAIENQKKGLHLVPEKKTPAPLIIPSHLLAALGKNNDLKKAYYTLSPYKQKEYAEYIATAKQEKTKLSRLEKSIPLILEGKGLNDKYR
ncbi:Uncharacterized conserved protein YdeI, YjbR/CyaY-like superfamily, DUF1801 family [Maribacter sedimenticola]|uniref:Uncharacterized conserved protein YdeI, YjbR/CyaY-like superfamily, DUF1801 family n=1 Tax=Maribacter sedimenticola TaxID=228956 RepID=A0ABY1SEP1_9FLAO|nr:DUF1801 domain-containing protein [Maribacter sedimenticola]SNR32005.1 Uncharacterized conserved protein YdeI, YjbR/CyaY-like superfamily, DUF1801 family [Maribacter sedimenticola]